MFITVFYILQHATGQQRGRVLVLCAPRRPSCQAGKEEMATLLRRPHQGRPSPPATAPQPNFTCLVVAQLVGSHLCGGPAMKGLDVLPLKAIKDHLGDCWQAFFMGAKQGAAEAPQEHLIVSRAFFLKTLLMSCWSSEITCKVEE